MKLSVSLFFILLLIIFTSLVNSENIHTTFRFESEETPIFLYRQLGSSGDSVLGTLKGIPLLTGPIGSIPRNIYENLIKSMEKTVIAVASVDSFSSIVPKSVEDAGLASADLLNRLANARDTTTDTTLEARLDDAISSIIKFVNLNELIPGRTFETINSKIIMRNKETKQSEKLDTLKDVFSSNAVMEKVDDLRNRIMHIESMNDLLNVLEEAGKYENTLRPVGEALHRLAETLGVSIDFDPIKNFAFKF